jgi:SAM-dependent methyltransferase
MDASATVLEIGCGTGQATRDVARRVGSVRCLEPGASLAALARQNLASFPTVTVEEATFEEASLEAGSYDVVFSATAFHWIDASVGYAKAARALRRSGSLALVTNAHAYGGTQHLIDTEMRELHQRLAPEIGSWTFPTSAQIAETVAVGSADIASIWARVDRSFADTPDTNAWFEPTAVTLHPWTASYDRDGYLAMLATQSSYARHSQSEALLEEVGTLIDARLGGQITKAYVAILAVARRR